MSYRVISLLCAALYIGTASAAVPIACQESSRPQKYQMSLDFSGELPIPDYLDALRACMAPMGVALPTPSPPASAWQELERELYGKVLARGKADLLVVPFQVQGYGLDRIERSLMTADLAYALSGAGKRTIADPFLVARALGEGARRIEVRSAESLAEKLGARQIILGFVGHDKNHALTLTLQLRELAATPGMVSRKVWQKDWRALPFTDEQTPAQVLHAMLPDVLRQLPLAIKVAGANPPLAEPPHISGSPRTLVTHSDRHGPAPDLLDLFGALTASTDEHSREREFVRAVVAAWRSPRDDAHSRFTEAYALMNLERRPSALALLTGLNAPEAVTLRALLQGDLLAAKASIDAVERPLEQFLLQVSLRDLQFKYQREPRIELSAAAALFGKNYKDWQSLVELRSGDADPWSNGSAPDIKVALDKAFPMAGLDADSVINGGVVVSSDSPSIEAIDMANIRHVRQAAEGIPLAPCCSLDTLRPTQWDLLWLLEGTAESRVAKATYQTIDLQGQMKEALATVDHGGLFYGGNPLLAAARADAAGRLSLGAAPEVLKALSQQIHEYGLLAAFWAHGESHLAARALRAAGTGDTEAAYLLDAYAYDYPRRSYWLDWFIGEQAHPEQRTAFTLESLAFSRDDLTPLSQLRSGNGPGQYGAVAATFGTRFAGNPRLPASFASDEERKAYEADPIPGLRAAIAKDPENWLNYGGLGGCLILFHGDYEAAAKAYLSFPGFAAKQPEDPVALAGSAHEAGWNLYRAGRPELARPLLTIAADLDTGSAASLLSRQWLLTLDANYVGAAAAARDRATTYNDASAYRDYLSLLHVVGASTDAWKGFSQLLASFDSSDIWISALVGHGRQGANEKAVRAWLLRPDIRMARLQNRHFAADYAVTWNATDRLPPADLGQLVEQIDGPPVAHINADGVSLLVSELPGSGAQYTLRPSPFRVGKTTRLPPGTAIKSKVAYFADAYAALRHGDFAGAVAKFSALADHYAVEDSPYGGEREAYPLSYFAYAAAKTGDTLGLEAYVSALKTPRSFDVWLAKAYFAGARGDKEAAAKALETAFRNMPVNNDDRPLLADYQYAEACESLYRDTHDSRFLATLLDWATRYQRIRPTYAWAYAMQYAYEKDPQQRRRALALAYYLDPAAEHIQHASKEELTQAREWLRDHNPFQKAAPKTTT